MPQNWQLEEFLFFILEVMLYSVEFFLQMCFSMLYSDKAKLCSCKDLIPSDWNMIFPGYLNRKSCEMDT